MSATLEAPSPALTLKERSALATRHFCEALGLDSVAPKELNYLTVALAEAAAEEVTENPAFRQKVQNIFRALQPKATTAPEGARPKRKRGIAQLVAVGAVDPALVGPGAPTDPYVLLQIYGKEQLPIALGEYGMDRLKEAARIVQQRHPGTKPASLAKRAALIEYIMRYVAEK